MVKTSMPEVELTDEQMQGVAEHGELKPVAITVERCDCGRMRAFVLVEIPSLGVMARAVHLPDDVTLDRAMRNLKAITTDALVNGVAMPMKAAHRFFPSAKRYEHYVEADIRGFGHIPDSQMPLIERLIQERENAEAGSDDDGLHA